jgi:hypothetical protein
MDNHYDLRSWSKLYRQEALKEARECHLAAQVRASRKQRFRRSLMDLVRATRAALRYQGIG